MRRVSAQVEQQMTQVEQLQKELVNAQGPDLDRFFQRSDIRKGSQC
jgi:hypothetical protein